MQQAENSGGTTVKKRARATDCFLRTAFVLLLIVLAGCAGWPWQAGPPLKTATADQLVQLLRERAAPIESMKAQFRAQIKGPGIPISQRVEAAFYYRRADALRIRGFNQVGGELFDFVLNRNVYLLRTQGARPVEGQTADLERAGSDDVRRPFQLGLLAVTGAIGIAPVGDEADTRLTEEGDQYRLDVLTPDGPGGGKQLRRRLWFDRGNLQVVREERLLPDGVVDATMDCDDFRSIRREPEPAAVSTAEPGDAAGAWVRPYKVTVQDGQGKGWFSLTFHEIIPNPPLTPSELGKKVP